MRSRNMGSDSNVLFEEDSVRNQRRSLSQAIEALRSPQRIYMPGVSASLDDIDPDSVTDSLQSVRLHLPSSVPAASRDSWCTSDLPLIEFRLRYAQAVDALNEIRRLRRLYRGLMLQTLKHPSPTQRTKTRSQGVFQGLNARILLIAGRYRDARTALLRLYPTGTWKRYIQELKRADTQGPFEEDIGPQGINFVPSWIWTIRAPPKPPGLPTSDNDLQTLYTPATDSDPSSDTPDDLDDIKDEEIEDYVRVDWAKAQERAKRFEEEIGLTTEDMRRTLAFFAWKAEEWDRLAGSRVDTPNKPTDEVIQGLQAYAYRKSSMYCALIKSFVSTWHDCLYPKGLGGSWLSGYADIIVPQKRWNKIPSIIPTTSDEVGLRDSSGDTSDGDDCELAPSAEHHAKDPETELYDDFVDILAYS